MLDKLLQIETLSIVLIGKFNPAIFQPIWFNSKGLLGESETKEAEIDIIHQEIARYTVGNWLNIEVTKNRCEFKTNMQPYFSMLKDLVVGTFKILKETPIEAFGFNNIFELSLFSEKDFYKFGSKLTYLNLWEGSLKEPRLLTLEILEQKNQCFDNASQRIRITSSDPSLNISFGVMINVNNHFINKEGKALDVISIIEKQTDFITKQSSETIDKIISKILS